MEASTDVIELDRAFYDEIVEQALAENPNEACGVIAGAIQHCCRVKTPIAIPAHSRSSTLCESSMPAVTLIAVRIHRRCRCPCRAKSTATEGLRICWSIRVGSVQKNGGHRCWHKACIG